MNLALPSGPTRTVRTMCPMNCHPTLCGMLAEVQGDQLVGVRGDQANPDSRGFLCIRGQASREIIGNSGRLLTPLLRDGRNAEFRPASWDEALERVARAMGDAPAEATAFWPGHGSFATNYGTRITAQLIARFAHLHGSRFWNPTMICWGMGAFGLALTGLLETNTKEDMAAASELVVLWGANLASQPNTAPHLMAARARGAHLVTIDVRRTEAAAKSDEVLLLRPGSDAALALALMHVICGEGLHDAAFVERHTSGFAALRSHVHAFSPAWAAERTGIAAEAIVALARRYAGTKPAMIVLGGSSMHKGGNGWQAARAVSCLPALTGNVGIAGGGLGPRHGSAAHGRGLANLVPSRRASLTGDAVDDMASIGQALRAGRIRNLLLFGTNMLSSFADADALAHGLAATRLIVSHDLFMNDTARRFADVVLPSTAWLEELGCKATNTHLYLMEPALPAAGQTRSANQVLRDLAARVGLTDFDPWGSDEATIDAILAHPCTGHATVAALRAEGSMRAMNVSHIAHPDLRFATPSGRLEFFSTRAQELGLPPLPVAEDACPVPRSYPLALAQGRTLNQFHAFYDHGRALPTLARKEAAPQLWIAPQDAATRGITHGALVRVFNERGAFEVAAHVTDRIPAGTLWLRDGWPGLNRITGGAAVLPAAAVDAFAFSAGQARFDAAVEVRAVS